MNTSESFPQSASTEHMRLLLTLIEDTHQMQVMGEAYRSWGRLNPAPFLDFTAIAERTAQEIRANATAINESLLAMGGIRHYFINPSTKARTDCLLQEWQGIDPEATTNHLWKVRELPGQVVSLTPDMFEELRSQAPAAAELDPRAYL